jgi:hypothetical protein
MLTPRSRPDSYPNNDIDIPVVLANFQQMLIDGKQA